MDRPERERPVSLRTRYCAAQSFDSFLEGAAANAELWRSIARRATVPAAIVDRVRAAGGQWHLLVIAEDWCGDAVNTLPVLARLAEVAGNVGLRILSRDASPDLMDAHRSASGAAAIPVVMIVDEGFVERTWWGSRPGALQAWVDDVGMTLPKEERYREVRGWYARDRGASALDEIVSLIEEVAAVQRAA